MLNCHLTADAANKNTEAHLFSFISIHMAIVTSFTDNKDDQAIVQCVAQLVCLVLPFFGAPIPSPGASLLPRTCRNGLAKKKWRFSFGWGRESGHKARKDDIFKNIQFGDDIFGLLQFEDDIYKHEMGEFFIVLLNQKNTLSL